VEPQKALGEGTKRSQEGRAWDLFLHPSPGGEGGPGDTGSGGLGQTTALPRLQASLS
jgi:hypothetical protein